MYLNPTNFNSMSNDFEIIKNIQNKICHGYNTEFKKIRKKSDKSIKKFRNTLDDN